MSRLAQIPAALGRSALRAWGRTLVKPSYYYIAVERFGAALADRPLIARLPNGCRIPCDLRDEVQRQIWFLGAYEPVDSSLFVKLLRPGLTVIDAGANAGQYSLLAATAIGPEGVVHAFEPIPATFERLARAVTDNGLANVRLNQAALWHEATTLQLGLPADHLANSGAFTVGAGGPATIEAPAVRLDDYVREQGLSRVDLIKMDIEGAEPYALAGARETLGRWRPLLLLEINPGTLADLGRSPEAIWSELAPFGYRAWKIDSDLHLCRPLPNLTGVGRCNVIFHHDDLPPAVTSGWTWKQALAWAQSGWSHRGRDQNRKTR
ncbi:MAG: FkbM family methyltransferase [Isosphaeraceae bacterium]|nr:FkbM family methyltransferase [Isosphaeraceae bacterium]